MLIIPDNYPERYWSFCWSMQEHGHFKMGFSAALSMLGKCSRSWYCHLLQQLLLFTVPKGFWFNMYSAPSPQASHQPPFLHFYFKSALITDQIEQTGLPVGIHTPQVTEIKQDWDVQSCILFLLKIKNLCLTPFTNCKTPHTPDSVATCRESCSYFIARKWSPCTSVALSYYFKTKHCTN